jgi:hypothetical protein
MKVPLLFSVSLSGPHLDMGRRESSQKPQGALADTPDGIGDSERPSRLLGVMQGLLGPVEVFRRAMAAHGWDRVKDGLHGHVLSGGRLDGRGGELAERDR